MISLPIYPLLKTKLEFIVCSFNEIYFDIKKIFNLQKI